MSENIKNLENEKEINLNLKIPPEQADGSFSMRDLVLTLYNGRKIFFLCCAVGLLLGIIAAAGYYVSRTGGTLPVTTTASVTLTLNYPGAEEQMFPNGAEFNASSFYEPELWENALNAVGRDDITPADAMNQVVIARYAVKLDEYGLPIDDNIQNQLFVNTLFEITIPASSAVFPDDDAKETFLQAFCMEYKNFINSKYFIEDNIGILWNQNLREWNDVNKEIIWDNFNFEKNFSMLDSRYSEIIRYLDELFSANPLYSAPNGRSFNDFARELREINDNDIRIWSARINENVYIRNIDRFRNEYQFQLDSMRINREYSLELIASYNELLSSFQQKDTPNGAIVLDAVETLTTAREHADNAADLQRLIRQTENNVRALDVNESTLRTNSHEAESALTAFIEDLERNQDELNKIIFDYYRQVNERNAGNSVLFTTPETQTSAAAVGVSMTRVFMLFAGLTFMGFAFGFCAAFVKKYLPEKGKK
jgi:hypothetical protein